MRIVETTWVGAAGKIEKLPLPSLPEIAFAGRSNVGKSSLLNALCARRSLFAVSRTPGRTRTIVHVEARLDTGPSIYLVDLPGYGYAKVAKGAKVAWGRLVEGYLRDRASLHLVVLLVDLRRGPEVEEARLLDFLADIRVPAMLVATKIDKVEKGRRQAALERLGADTGCELIGVSSVTRDGVDRLLARVARAAGYGP